MKMISYLSSLIWDDCLIYLLIFVALFFSFSLGFVQVRHFIRAMLILVKSDNTEKMGISSFQALCTSLASRIGTGNIVGVGIAIYIGGPGAIFWMWLLAFLGMATSFAEGVLAQLYKVKDVHGNMYRGGPAYYIKMGLKNPFWANVFAVALILTYIVAFNSVQSNSIGSAYFNTFKVPQYIVGGVVATVAGLMIFGGIQRIAKMAQWIVPLVGLAYFCVMIAVVVLNYSKIPVVLQMIFGHALGIKAAGAGMLGYTIHIAMTQGIRRGLFSNEAGMGSAPNIAAAAHTYHPVTQGYLQMLGPFFDTIIVCTCTAFMILFSEEFVPGSGLTGVSLVQRSLESQIGFFGGFFITFSLTCFAFMAMLGNYTYAEMSLYFVWPGVSDRNLMIFRVLALLVIAVAPNYTIDFIMSLSDLTMGVMAAINLPALLLLSKEVQILFSDYIDHIKRDKKPQFNVKEYGVLASKINNTGVW